MVRKSLIIVHMIVVAIAALSACDDFERVVVVPEIEMEDNLLLEAASERCEISLKSSYPWFAESNVGWITLHKYRGNALLDESIVLEVSENEALDPRVGTVSIRLMDQMTKVLTITQNGLGEYVSLSNERVLFNKFKSECFVTVNTRVDWTLDKEYENGFRFSFVDQNTLKVEVEDNVTGNERTATVTLASKLNPDRTAMLTATQVEAESLISITLPDDDKVAVVPKTGGDVNIPVAVDAAYRCVTSNDWISVASTPEVGGGGSVENFTLTLSLTANMTGEERCGWVRIENIANPEYNDTFMVAQRGVGKIVYCKPGGTGDGTSWEYAYGDILKAMAVCDNLGDMELWCAEGEYQITSPINKKSINVYGGFRGTEKSLSERDLSRKSIIRGGAHQLMYAWNANGPEGVYYYMDGFILTGTNTTAGDTGNIQLWQNQGLRNCIVHGNYYGKNSGGYFNGSRVVNCIFYDNSCDWSAPVHVENAELINVLIVNNKVNSSAAATALRIAGDSKIINTVMWGNSGNATGLQTYLDASGRGTFINCAVVGELTFNSDNKPAAARNIISLTSENPGFVNPSVRDYSYLPSAKMIDAGDNLSIEAMKIATDIVGTERIVNGVIDLGAYEYKQ